MSSSNSRSWRLPVAIVAVVIIVCSFSSILDRFNPLGEIDYVSISTAYFNQGHANAALISDFLFRAEESNASQPENKSSKSLSRTPSPKQKPNNLVNEAVVQQDRKSVV
jgi:hypothetical protein